jgi:hypothetical protein
MCIRKQRRITRANYCNTIKCQRSVLHSRLCFKDNLAITNCGQVTIVITTVCSVKTTITGPRNDSGCCLRTLHRGRHHSKQADTAAVSNGSYEHDEGLINLNYI